MVELAKVFLKHGAAVAVALIEPEANSADFSAAVARSRASNPSVSFHVLPPPTPTDTDPQAAAAAASANPVTKMFQFLAAMNAPLRDFLRSLPSVDAPVVDMFCGDAQDVAAELELPVYNFYASGAATLAIFLNLPSVVAGNRTKIKDLGDSLIASPGAPPFKGSELPSEVINSGDGLPAVLDMFERIPYADGILIKSLETCAVRALRDGLCVPSLATPRRRSTASGRWSREEAVKTRA
jgi:hypothetical protein